ncbi:hypothetical protein GGS26DRAFT_586860 [Hypomontagnella submonticulosa]|nr:hypothetical protein GGS26DRAFT_586860 [Hypomontagnella submonticulosa]
MSSCMGGFRAFTARLQKLVGVKPKSARSEKPPLQISAPFNFKHETISLPGVSEDEIAVLKEQAAASRFGMTDPSSIGTPRKAPSPPTLGPLNPPVLKVTPSSPIGATENLI